MNCYERIDTSLKEICIECKFYGTGQCVPLRCNIGFTWNAINAAKVNGQKAIEDGVKLIPKDDMKVYETNAVAKSIASVCKLCRQCKENHSENCIVALSRRSLERTHLREDVVYPGNILMYLFNVAKQDLEFSDRIKTEYSQIE